jgi:hypothetical protein
MRIFLLVLLALTTAGCATVTRGTTDQMTVTSTPTGAHVTTSLAQSCLSPCTFNVSRKDEFIVTVAADGYKSQEIPVKTQLAGNGAAGFAGNLLLGGVVGMGVDVATGSTLEHVPNPIHVDLEAIEAPAAAARRPRGAKPVPKPLAEAAPLTQ